MTIKNWVTVSGISSPFFVKKSNIYLAREFFQSKNFCFFPKIQTFFSGQDFDQSIHLAREFYKVKISCFF